MAIIIELVQNIPDLLRSNEIFFVPPGQTVVNGEVIIEDGAEFVFEDTASLLVTDC